MVGVGVEVGSGVSVAGAVAVSVGAEVAVLVGGTIVLVGKGKSVGFAAAVGDRLLGVTACDSAVGSSCPQAAIRSRMVNSRVIPFTRFDIAAILSYVTIPRVAEFRMPVQPDRHRCCRPRA